MKEGNQPFNAQKALRVACLVLADLILINLSAFLALYIRFEFDLKLLCETEFLHNMIVYSGINSVCTILIFYILKLYNSLWEFAGVSELVRTAVGCFFSAVFYMVGMFMLHLTVPRSFPAIYMLVLCLLCGALRFAYRCARPARASGCTVRAAGAPCSSAAVRPAPSCCASFRPARARKTRSCASLTIRRTRSAAICAA